MRVERERAEGATEETAAGVETVPNSSSDCNELIREAENGRVNGTGVA